VMAHSRDGNLPKPVSLAALIRSSTRAWAQCRASKNASCPTRCWWRRLGSANRQPPPAATAAHRGAAVRGGRSPASQLASGADRAVR
jgi:hypothetical protein